MQSMCREEPALRGALRSQVFESCSESSAGLRNPWGPAHEWGPAEASSPISTPQHDGPGAQHADVDVSKQQLSGE